MSQFEIKNSRERDKEIIAKSKQRKNANNYVISLNNKYILINTRELLLSFLDKLVGDISLKVIRNDDTIFGIAISVQNYNYYIDVNILDENLKKSFSQKLKLCRLIGYRIASDVNSLYTLFNDEFLFYWDVYLAAKVLNENLHSYLLQDLCKIYNLNSDEELYKILTIDINTRQHKNNGRAFGEYSRQIKKLYEYQSKYLLSEKMKEQYSLFMNIEMPSAAVLSSMERLGITFDESKRKSLYNKYLKLLSTTEKSNKAYLSYEKMLNTYLMFNKYVRNDGKIHTIFDQYGSVTGRIYSTKPPLQQMPSKGETKEIRNIFRAKDNYILLSADFSSQEPRIITHLSNDKKLIDIYKNKQDLYAIIASKVYNREYKDCLEYYDDGRVNDEGKSYRTKGKIIWLSLSYGATTNGLAKELDCSVNEAQKIIDTIYSEYPGLFEYRKNIIDFAKKNKYVTTLWGRKRRFPQFKNIKDLSQKDLAKLERQCVNSVIQGSGADMIKKAMITIHNDDILQKLGLELLLPIHDELLCQCPIENVDDCSKRVKLLMESCANDKMDIPLKVDINVFTNWE